MPSLELVHDEFNYNPRTGDLTYNRPRRLVVVGQVVVSHSVRVPASGTQYPVSRIIWFWMTGEDPGDLLVEHQDGNHRNNRWHNLRLATPQQNMFNKEGIGQFAKGVVFKADANRSKPWPARIRIDGKKVPLGSFYTHDEAAEAYRVASEKIHGAFASHKSRT